MATLVGATEKDVIKLLEDLVHLDYDAIDAYEAAIDRLKNAGDKQQLASFLDDHVQHTRNLGAFLRRMGREPPTKGDFKRMLTKGKVLFGGMFSDRAILVAMKTNEDDTNRAYERALRHENVPSDIVEVLSKNLADERRHRAWIQGRLGREHEVGVSPRA